MQTKKHKIQLREDILKGKKQTNEEYFESKFSYYKNFLNLQNPSKTKHKFFKIKKKKLPISGIP